MRVSITLHLNCPLYSLMKLVFVATEKLDRLKIKKCARKGQSSWFSSPIGHVCFVRELLEVMVFLKPKLYRLLQK